MSRLSMIDAIILGATAFGALTVMVVIGLQFIRWRRNRFRFRIRTLLFVFAIVGCSLFAILQFIVPTFEHRWAIRQIHASGGRTIFPEDYEKGDYNESRRRANYWRDVSTVKVRGNREAITVAKHLESIPELKMVDLHGVTDRGLEAICQVGRRLSLEYICLFDSEITGADLSDMSNLKSVHELFFNTCQVDAAALAHFRSLPSLRELWIVEEGRPANPARYTQECFSEIGRMEDLEHLWFTNLQVSDAAARRLHNLKRLKVLKLGFCQISDQSIADLQQALPNCEIRIYERKPIIAPKSNNNPAP
jgi:hypothetical protein